MKLRKKCGEGRIEEELKERELVWTSYKHIASIILK